MSDNLHVDMEATLALTQQQQRRFDIYGNKPCAYWLKLDTAGELNLARHEGAIGVVSWVISEGGAGDKAVLGVKSAGGVEGGRRARFEAKTVQPVCPRQIDQGRQKRSGNTFSLMRGSSAHGFKLTMAVIKPMERPAAKQVVLLPCCQEYHLRAAQGRIVERMDTFGRGMSLHISKMDLEKRLDFRVVELAVPDLQIGLLMPFGADRV